MNRTQPETNHGRVFEKRWAQFLPRPIEEVFAFFSDAGNLELLTPKMLRFVIDTPMPIQMQPGTLIDYSLRIRGVPVKWRTRIAEWEPPHRFVDEQLRGPYKLWWHEHTFESHEGGTICRDHVKYAVPGGPLAPLVNWLVVDRDVERIFAHRAKVMTELFGHAPPDAPAPTADHEQPA
jgi:ligand-binding SRPBCC domain-containing protein